MKKAVRFGSIAVFVLSCIPVVSQSATNNTFDYPIGFGITASPAIEISSKYDDNIFLQDNVNVRSSWITELAPSLMLGAQQGANYYTAKYTMKAGRYHSSRNDDYVDHLLQFNTHNEFNSRNKLDLSFDYLNLHENRGSGITGAGATGTSSTPDEYRDTVFSGLYTYGTSEGIARIELEGSHLDKKYTNHRSRTRGFDRKEDFVGATFFYRVMPKTSLLFETNYKDIDYVNDPVTVAKLDGDETTFQVGLTWDSTAKTTGRVQIGRTYKDFDASARKDYDFTSWAIGVSWLPRTYSVFNFDTSSSATETNGTGNFIRNKTYAATWNHAWSDKISSNAQIRFTNEDYVANTRDDDLEYYTAGMEYRFRRGVAFGLDYTYSTRDSNVVNSDYNDSAVMLSVKVGM